MMLPAPPRPRTRKAKAGPAMSGGNQTCLSCPLSNFFPSLSRHPALSGQGPGEQISGGAGRALISH